MDGSFSEAVYDLLSKKVPKGKVTTYAALARALGTSAYRAVGTAMKNNSHMRSVPCHRVIPSNRTLGGYNGGEPKKLALLQEEGIEFVDGKIPEKYILRVL